MTVVVGYVPDSTGYLAVTEAVSQARWRQTGVIVVNAVDHAGYTRPTAADEIDLDALTARLSKEGVPHEIRHLDLGNQQASDAILAVIDEVGDDRRRFDVRGLHQRGGDEFRRQLQPRRLRHLHAVPEPAMGEHMVVLTFIPAAVGKQRGLEEVCSGDVPPVVRGGDGG